MLLGCSNELENLRFTNGKKLMALGKNRTQANTFEFSLKRNIHGVKPNSEGNETC
jgi:hypothetical protein